MKGIFAIGIVALFLFGGSSVVANAKNTTHHDQAVTGCLESGGSTGQYTLTAQNGTTWQIKEGEYVNLSPYVGQTVAVAGPETTKHKDHLTVMDVAVDSQSCHQ
jgi:hypothetical protein